jgi:hypothetical protein
VADLADLRGLDPRQFAFGHATGVKASGYVNVAVGGEVVSCHALRDVTFAADDPVLVAKHGSQWFVVGRYGTAAPTQPDIDTPPAPKPPNPISGTLVVPPTYTASYRTGSFTGWRDGSDVYQGQFGGYGNHTGCVFYGSKPRSLDGATVTSASFRVRRDNSGGAFAAQTTTMRLLTGPTKPGGSAPTLSSSATGPRLARGQTNNSFTLPTSWAQALVDGTATGIAFFVSDGTPYVIFNGKGTWSAAFILTIRYTR